MDADEVVPAGVERDHVGVVLDLLPEPVHQAGEPAHVHPHREILALDVTGADVRLFQLGLEPSDFKLRRYPLPR